MAPARPSLAPRAPARKPAGTTAERVLDAAERLMQTQGFNVVSYADLAAEVGITTASLHYHFRTKADLGRMLLERYTGAFGTALASIRAAHRTATSRLRAYGKLYEDVLAQGRLCLCGMLAAEISTLPAPMQAAIRVFFDGNETWLLGVLDEGRHAGEIALNGSARDAARLWTSSLEGAMLLARCYGEPARLAVATERLLREVRPSRPVG